MSATLSAMIPVIGWALLQFVWQGLVIGAAAAFVMWLLRDSRPQARYAVACAALALCLVLPALGIVAALVAAPGGGAAALSGATELATIARISIDPAPLASWQARLDAQLPWLVALWALGAGALALRMALGLAWVHRIGRSSPDIADAFWQARLTQLAARMGVARHVSLRVATALDGPVAAGWWRPMVLVPAALVARMPPDLLEALLAHELAHIRRHDYLVNLAQSAIEALLFYHPVVWWLSRRVRVEREQIADDLAAQALGEPRRLALALQELDRFQITHQQLALAANGGHLMSRIQRLIRPQGRSLNWHTLTWRMALPILGLTVACVTVYAQGTTPAARPVLATASVPATPATPAMPAVAAVASVPAVRAMPSVPAVATVSATTNVNVMHPRSLQVNTDGNGDGYALVHADDEGMNFSGNTRDLSEVEKLRAKIGGDFLWFRRDGKSYVIRDPALVAQADAAWKPMAPVSAKMEALSREMEVHSEKMEALSRKMEASSGRGDPVSVEMDRLSAKMDALSGQQEALSEHVSRLAEKLQDARSDAERQALHAEMAKLARQRQPLDEQMHQLAQLMSQQSQKLQAMHQPMEALSREMEQATEPMQALGEQMGVLGKQQEKISLEADRKVRSLIDQATRNGQAQPAGNAAPN